MVRSPWLRVYPARLCRAFRTRFRSGSVPEGLSHAVQGNSPAHYAIGTLSPVAPEDAPLPEGRVIGLQPLCRYTVSGPFDSPCGGAFHHSLALLFAIGRQLVLSLGGWSPRIQTGFPVSGPTWEHCWERGLRFRVRVYHPLWTAFPDGSANMPFCNSPDGSA
jgi:hypothetical protein